MSATRRRSSAHTDELVDVTRAASGSRAGLPLLNANASYTVHRVAAPFRLLKSRSCIVDDLQFAQAQAHGIPRIHRRPRVARPTLLMNVFTLSTPSPSGDKLHHRSPIYDC
ncbi:hypothetical protein M422DRAFT_258504 [Sphaerobolus stellatus SS14]|uniref:Uncharacterized protein n=1 Tax=Sphaerobolus stellatus (strain SS14) TaxID=990650 RepID=A0A0C9VLY5_SPHS4|nr:hypothetical protein M422DRAFT_258504 [Sphaerobolus stellatus SS14]